MVFFLMFFLKHIGQIVSVLFLDCYWIDEQLRNETYFHMMRENCEKHVIFGPFSLELSFKLTRKKNQS